jgi:hypothetical protein
MKPGPKPGSVRHKQHPRRPWNLRVAERQAALRNRIAMRRRQEQERQQRIAQRATKSEAAFLREMRKRRQREDELNHYRVTKSLYG